MADKNITNDNLNAQLDEFTVLLEVDASENTIDNKAYEVDQTINGDFEELSANPLLGISEQRLHDTVFNNSEDTNISDAQNLNSVFLETPNEPSSFGINQKSNKNEDTSDPEFHSHSTHHKSRVESDDIDLILERGDTNNDFNTTPEISLNLESPFNTPSQENELSEEAETFALEPQDNNRLIEEVLLNRSDDAIENEITEDIILSPSLEIRVSNETFSEKEINSADGYDLVAFNYDNFISIDGVQMDIASVSDNAAITYNYITENSAHVTLDTAWNSVKNIEAFSETNAEIYLNNFVHTDVQFSDGGNSYIEIDHAKRGNIETGSGDDYISIDAETNNAGWSNLFNIDTNDGNDTVLVSGDKGITSFDINTGDGNDHVTVGGDYSIAHINLGLGDDVVQTGTSANILTGGGGHDNFLIDIDSGPITITDFGGVGRGGKGDKNMLPEFDTLKLEGDEFTAENMLIDYDGEDTIITFDGLDNFSITLEDFDFTNLDNVSTGHNILFDGQITGTDAYDVFNNHNDSQHSIWNKDTTTFLNNDDNTVKGKNNSDDVINGMDGNDTLEGKSGSDLLRGGDGSDHLTGGKDNDIIDGGNGDDTAIFKGNFEDYTIYSNEDGSFLIQDTHGHRDGSDTVYNIEFFEFKDGIQDVSSQSWLNAIEANSEQNQMNAEENNFNSDTDSAIDLSYIMPDTMDMSNDPSGGSGI